MELGTQVTVKQDVSVEGKRLRGMRGIVVDRANEDDPMRQLALDQRFVRFPATHTCDEFFAWVKMGDLEAIPVQLN